MTKYGAFYRFSRRRNGMRGMNLIELLFALTIFTVSLLMIVGVFPMSIRSISKGKAVLLASHIGEQKLEWVRTLGFDQIFNVTQATPGSLADESITMTQSVNGSTATETFTVKYVVTDNIGGDANLKSVRVQVQWFEGFGTTGTQTIKKVELETYIARP